MAFSAIYDLTIDERDVRIYSNIPDPLTSRRSSGHFRPLRRRGNGREWRLKEPAEARSPGVRGSAVLQRLGCGQPLGLGSGDLGVQLQQRRVQFRGGDVVGTDLRQLAV